MKYQDARTFVVSWIHFADNVIFMEQVEALHEWQAVTESNQDIFEPNDMHFIMSKEELYEEAFNRDAMIEILEIKPG